MHSWAHTVGQKWHSQVLGHIFNIKALLSRGVGDIKLLCVFTTEWEKWKAAREWIPFAGSIMTADLLGIKKSKTPSIFLNLLLQISEARVMCLFIYTLHIYNFKTFWVLIISQRGFFVLLCLSVLMGNEDLITSRARWQCRESAQITRLMAASEPLVLLENTCARCTPF